MNISQIYEECGRLLNDPNNERWGQSILLSRINFAQTKVIAYTSAIKFFGTKTPVAGNPELHLDEDTMDIIRIEMVRPDGSIFRLKGYSREQIDFEFPNWQQLGLGAPVAYWWDGTEQVINLIPAPDAENAITNGFRQWAVHNPEPMIDSDDVPFAGNAAMVPYHMAIVHWVVAQCWMDDATPEALAKSRFHRSGLMDHPGQFELEIKRIINKYDSPVDIPARVLWRPQGARTGSYGRPTKQYPLG